MYELAIAVLYISAPLQGAGMETMALFGEAGLSVDEFGYDEWYFGGCGDPRAVLSRQSSSSPRAVLSRQSSSSTICTHVAPGDSCAGSEDDGVVEVQHSSGSDAADASMDSSGGGISTEASRVCRIAFDSSIVGGGASSSGDVGKASSHPPSRKDTTPKVRASTPGRGERERFKDRTDVGNIGWMFGNWGARASRKPIQENIDLQIKRCPAQVIGLCECQKATQDILEEPAVAGDPNEQWALQRRSGFEYLTIRGEEDKSNLLAVRKNMAEEITLLEWERRSEGEYRVGTGKTGHAYSRYLTCEIKFRSNVGFFGTSMVVSVIHLHNKVANHDKGFRKQQIRFWPDLVKKLTKFGVDVLMGDFNMSLFKIVPEVRSRGLRIELTAR